MSKKAHETALPKLRFPEFRDAEAWEIPPLGELMDGVSKRNRDNKISRVFTNSAVSGIIDQRDFFDKDIATAGKTDNYSVIESGDYVYNPRISESAPVGPTSRNKLGQGIVSPLYTVFRFSNSNHNEFYDYYFGSTHWQNSLKAIGNSGARHDRMGISLTQLRLVKVPYPSLAEQQKIAATLSSLDALLTAQTARLTALQAHKRGLMQDLFPAEGETVPKRRFPEFRDAGEWVQDELGAISNITSGATPNRDKPGYWDGNIPWVTTSLVNFSTINFANEYITQAGLQNSSSKLFPKNTILMAMYGQGKTRGQVAILGIEAATNQACAAILLKKGFDTNFVYQNLAARYQEIRELSNQGGQENLSGGLIKSIPFAYPEIVEQQKIADCLSSLDNLITAQAQKIEALKLHKKGLMQALFPAASTPNA